MADRQKEATPADKQRFQVARSTFLNGDVASVTNFTTNPRIVNPMKRSKEKC